MTAMSIAAECEAFLHGRYASLHVRAGRPMAAWVALNRVAHGDAAAIRAIAAGDVSDATAAGDEQQVARALVAHAIDDADLARLQHLALVPLELWLADAGATVGLSPRGAFGLACDAIDECVGFPRRRD
jgi:hypothetical protein